jgi:hypothetical protein
MPISRSIALLTGAASALVGVAGLVRTSPMALFRLRGGFEQVVAAQKFSNFYVSFDLMSLACALFNLALVVAGIGLVLGKTWSSRMIVWTVGFEVIYILGVGALWMTHSVSTGFAAATGVGNVGLNPQLYILFPIWSPIVLIWGQLKGDRRHV